MFDYQSDRHCAKTVTTSGNKPQRLITSQIDTAPKLYKTVESEGSSLITSQIDTAPKRRTSSRCTNFGLITSQIDTAPKQQLRASDRRRV